MEFRLLGPVSVVTAAGVLPLGPVKRRSLLAALLLRPNRPVMVEHLTAALWEQEPPATALSWPPGVGRMFCGCRRPCWTCTASGIWWLGPVNSVARPRR